jgi:hypothetical protein
MWAPRKNPARTSAREPGGACQARIQDEYNCASRQHQLASLQEGASGMRLHRRRLNPRAAARPDRPARPARRRGYRRSPRSARRSWASDSHARRQRTSRSPQGLARPARRRSRRPLASRRGSALDVVGVACVGEASLGDALQRSYPLQPARNAWRASPLRRRCHRLPARPSRRPPRRQNERRARPPAGPSVRPRARKT